MSASRASSSVIGFAAVLTIVFTVLRLLHRVSWSWWWVFSPLWIGAVCAVLVIAGLIGFAALIRD